MTAPRRAKRTKPPKTMGQLAGGRKKAVERHVHQFQMACLELERTRRMKELSIATQRVAEIHRRLGEIEAEMQAHLAAMPALGTDTIVTIAPAAGAKGMAQPVQTNSSVEAPAPGKNRGKRVEVTNQDGQKRRTLRY